MGVILGREREREREEDIESESERKMERNSECVKKERQNMVSEEMMH